MNEARLPGIQITSSSDAVEVGPQLGDFEIALGEPALLRDAVARMVALRWAQSTWAGVEQLLEPSLRRDYLLTNARGVFGSLMVEYVFAYLLVHERKVLMRYASQQASRWDPTPAGTLQGRTIGLIGVGSIGSALARTAKHFGMRVRGYTRATEDCADVDEYFHGEDRVRFAAEVDYLVCILPNTPRTRHLVDAALLAALPPHAIFVNPGRGQAVDEAALATALQDGRLAGAVLDVFETEPLPPDHVLWRTPNVLITSHTAAVSVPEAIAPIFLENYRRFAQGLPLRHQVDFDRGY